MYEKIRISESRPIFLMIKKGKGYYVDSFYADGSRIFSICDSKKGGIEIARVIIRNGTLYKVIRYRENEDWGYVDIKE